MFFCPNCNNALSITQQDQIGEQYKPSEIQELSSSENPEILALDNTSDANAIDDSTIVISGGASSDAVAETGASSNKAFLKCSNCGYAREIESGTLILSRVSGKSTTDYLSDMNKYKDMVHDMTLPHTTGYVCPNDKCKSHTDDNAREAVFFKPNRHSYGIIFVCKSCETVW